MMHDKVKWKQQRQTQVSPVLIFQRARARLCQHLTQPNHLDPESFGRQAALQSPKHQRHSNKDTKAGGVLGFSSKGSKM